MNNSQDAVRIAVRLMTDNPNCTVELKDGYYVDLRDLQDNQSVAKGGDNYYFLITRKG